MKLKTFQVYNYKSIKNSGICRLSDVDNISVLAGQNESGKSSLLQALHDYERGVLREDAYRDFDETKQTPTIYCTYTLDKDEDLFTLISEELVVPQYLEKKLTQIKEFTLYRYFNDKGEARISFEDTLDDEMIDLENKAKERANKIAAEATPPVEPAAPAEATPPVEPAAPAEATPPVEPAAPAEATRGEIVEEVFGHTPAIIFFDELTDLLPDKINLSDLVEKNTAAKGYGAVKNVETILGKDFNDLVLLKDHVVASRQTTYQDKITTDFNEFWTQKIFDNNKVDICIEYKQGGADASGPYLNFFIVTKTGEFLTPERRSKGMQWFLSFYLQLKAESARRHQLIVLFDEPGLYLHSKAQNDIKRVFEELAHKDQIIYATHSPYLIDADKLNRVRLVINDKNSGTTVEKITTKKVKGQHDALKPIIDAIGLEIAHVFSPINGKNVILEGISDYNYFSAMKKLLRNDNEYALLPSMGAPNVHLLMELCIGWGLDWLIIMDEDTASKTAYNKIKKNFFNNDDKEAGEKIHRIQDIDGIEEMFTGADLKLVNSSATFPGGTKKSIKVNEYGGKEIYSRIFLEKVNKGEIKKENISQSTCDKFNQVFDFIKAGF